MIVFSNTTPLIALSSVQSLHLLPALFTRVRVAASVVAECRAGGSIPVPDLASLPWIDIVPVPPRVPGPSSLWQLDAGERDTIELACNQNADLVIMDEKSGRNHAEFMGLNITGTLGVLPKARKDGLIPSFLALAEGMRSHGIHFNRTLIARLASVAGE